jgi:hypothetical protein
MTAARAWFDVVREGARSPPKTPGGLATFPRRFGGFARAPKPTEATEAMSSLAASGPTGLSAALETTCSMVAPDRTSSTGGPGNNVLIQ